MKKQWPQMNSLRMFSFCLLNWEFASQIPIVLRDIVLRDNESKFGV